MSDDNWRRVSIEFKPAENGYVMREFDLSMAEWRHTIAATPADLAARFDEWAARVSRDLRKHDWDKDKR